MPVTSPDTPWHTKLANQIQAGTGFTAASGQVKTATNPNLQVAPLAVFNPAGSGVALVFYSLKLSCSNAGTLYYYLVSADPALGAVVTPVNRNTLSAATSAASCSAPSGFPSASSSITGTLVEYESDLASATLDFLDIDEIFIVAPGYGVELFGFVSTAGNNIQAVAKWLEIPL